MEKVTPKQILDAFHSVSQLCTLLLPGLTIALSSQVVDQIRICRFPGFISNVWVGMSTSTTSYSKGSAISSQNWHVILMSGELSWCLLWVTLGFRLVYSFLWSHSIHTSKKNLPRKIKLPSSSLDENTRTEANKK